MPVQADVEGALTQLEQLHRRLLDLIEWQRILLQERRPHLPPGFDPSTSSLEAVRADLRTVHGHFLSLATHTHTVLHGSHPPGTASQRTQWRARLETLRRQASTLPVDE